MSLWHRMRAFFRNTPPTPSGLGSPMRQPDRPAPEAPSLAEMRSLLRAGMTRDEFFAVLDELAVTRGLRMSLPTCDDRLIGLPVAEGGELLCFLPAGVLSYVEYQGDILLEAE
jgi:hypothetical protein